MDDAGEGPFDIATVLSLCRLFLTTAEELRVKEPVLRRAWSALGKQSAQRQSVRGATVD